MARECPAKGKSKGKGKDGGKTMGKGTWGKGKAKGGMKGGMGPGGGKHGGKGSVGGKGKGEGKAGGKGWFGKGFYGGYQGVCHNCGVVGHKAAECGVYAVGDASAEDAASSGAGVQEMPMGGVWTVAAVESVDREGVTGRWRPVGVRGGGLGGWRGR